MKDVDRSRFLSDLADSNLTSSPPADVNELVNLYNTVLLDLLNKCAPKRENS